MFTKDDRDRILSAVRSEPRTIAELARILSASWVTAQRYVGRMIDEGEPLGIKRLREGTRGGVNIVFRKAALESDPKRSLLAERIISGRHRVDFSPLDLLDLVPRDRWTADRIDRYSENDALVYDRIRADLERASDRIVIFSGNLSFAALERSGVSLRDVLEARAREGVRVSIVCRVELPGLAMIRDVLAINDAVGAEQVRMRVVSQPLRGTVIDGRSAVFTEHLEPSRYREGELSKDTALVYRLQDEDWIAWLEEVFWRLFRGAVAADRRIASLEQVSPLIDG